MKVLMVNGSPRGKGNTKAALEAVADGIKEGLKPEELEIYDVSKHKLSACLACDGCKKNGGTCVQPDDTAELIQKIYDADILVFGTPVYFWGMSAQLKMVVDKLYSKDAELKKLDKNYKNNPDIKWNFTKFVVDRSGKVTARFEPTMDMGELEKCVEALI